MLKRENVEGRGQYPCGQGFQEGLKACPKGNFCCGNRHIMRVKKLEKSASMGRLVERIEGGNSKEGERR